MDKVTFLKYTNRLMDIKKTVDAKSDNLSKCFPEADIWYDDAGMIDMILDLLTECVPGTVKWDNATYKSDIEWFWYERVCWAGEDKPITAVTGDREYILDTWEDLYDMITAAE